MLTALVVAFGLLACSSQFVKAAPVGTAFTYQGHLYDASRVADGPYDFQFKLFDDPNVIIGNQVGSNVNVADVDVIDGYFTVELDFGSVFDGNSVWLEIGVRPGEQNDPNAYTTLSPRQEVTPTPYALYAKTAGSDNDWMVSGNDMYSIPSGNVGIGTTSPGAALEIVGEGVANHLVLTNLGSPGPALRLNALNKDWVIMGTSPGAPSGDQQLVFRDFSAAKDRMAIDRYGNVGIGTTYPSCTFDVTGTQDSSLVSQPNATHMFVHLTNTTENTGEGPGIGFSNSSVKENIGAKIVHIRTGSQSTGDLAFYTKNSGTQGDYTTEKMRIKANGSVGIGTDSPGNNLKLDVAGRIAPDWGSTTDATYRFGDGSENTGFASPSSDAISVVIDGSEEIHISAFGYVGIGDTSPAYRLELPNDADASGRGRANAWSTYSSRRLKKNIKPIENALDKVKRLRGVYFDWKKDGIHDIGMVAEEVGEVIPEVVDYEANGVDAASLSYGRLVALLIEAVKEQQCKIAELEATIAQREPVEQRLKTLERMIQQQQFAIAKEVQQ